MNAPVVHTVNAGFTWLVVALSILGYVITIRRAGQRWSMWIVMATGWTLLAIPNTLLALGVSVGRSETTAVWLCSYVLVMASLVLIFLRLAAMVRHRRS